MILDMNNGSYTFHYNSNLCVFIIPFKRYMFDRIIYSVVNLIYNNMYTYTYNKYCILN